MQTLMWRCGCSGWVSPPTAASTLLRDLDGQVPHTAPYSPWGRVLPCHPHTVGPWVGAGCSVPHRKLPDLIQAGLGMPAGDTWQCPAGHCSWPHLSQHPVVLHCISSWLFCFKSLFTIPWLHLVDGVMEFLLGIMSLGQTLRWLWVSQPTYMHPCYQLLFSRTCAR